MAALANAFPPRRTPHARRSARSPARAWRRTPPGRPGSTPCAAVTVPLLPAGHAPLKVLHLSDIHMAPDQRAKQEWLRGLADLEPDLVINTGDNLAHMRARCPSSPTRSADCSTCRASTSSGPTTTTRRACATRCSTCSPTPASATPRRRSCRGPTSRNASPTAGWLDLTNGFGSLTVGGTSIAFAGVDDPHLGYDDLARVAGPADRDGRRAARRHARAVPPGPRPVRRRRLRRDHRRPHPRRPGVPARAAARSPPTATSSPPGPAACTATPPTPRPATTARRGCTSRPGSAPTPTSASGWPAAPRRR